ncbi:hypothetical protein DSECCO2_60720 [anaerobic digester metagenome]
MDEPRPSPNVHFQEVISPMDLSVNITCCGLAGLIERLNFATGLFSGVTITFFVVLFDLPNWSLTERLIRYGPTDGNVCLGLLSEEYVESPKDQKCVKGVEP